MDSMSAFANGEAKRGNELMVFDWHKAANIIKDRNPDNVSAGLSGDWEWTGGLIFSEGKQIPNSKTYTYLASTWATPEIDVDGEVFDCYIMESKTEGWDSATYWPDTALKILNETTK